MLHPDDLQITTNSKRIKGETAMKRFAVLLALLCLFAGSAFGQGSRYDGTAQKTVQGFLAPIPGALITVCTSAGVGLPCTPVTPIYTDSALTQQIPGSIIIADSLGNWGFWAAPGTYKVSITAAGVTGQLLTVTLPCAAGISCLSNPTTAAVAINSPGSLTVSGAATYQREQIFAGGSCTVAGLQAAIAALGANGGKVDFTACTTITTNITNATGSIIIPQNAQVFLGPSTWTCTITTASTPCWNITGSGAKLIGAGAQLFCTGGNCGTSSDSSNPANTDASGSTNLLCSSCGTTTDVVYAAIPNASRIGFTNSILSNIEISGLWINNGNSGRHALDVVSCHDCQIHDNRGYNFPGDGLLVQADLSSPNNGATTYRSKFDRMLFMALNSNTTGANCHFDASNGELHLNMLDQLYCTGNATNGGGLIGCWFHSGTAANDGFNQNWLQNSYCSNPVSNAASYGIKFTAPGNFSTQAGGRIADLSISDVIVERLFASALGTAIGVVDGTNTPNGTGAGAIILSATVVSSNWNVGIDRNNMGAMYIENPNASGTSTSAGMRFGGTILGPNSFAIQDTAGYLATGNNQLLIGYGFQPPTFSKGAFTGSNYIGFYSDIGSTAFSGAGTMLQTTEFYAGGNGNGAATANFAFYEAGSARNSFGGPLEFRETTAPSAFAASDVCYGDSTAHALKCSYNNGTFWTIPQTVASGTATMTTALIATVACGTTVTVAATGVLTTDVIDWSVNAAVTAANNGLLILKAWPTAGNVNFNYCNPTAAGVTPTATTVNWSVRRP